MFVIRCILELVCYDDGDWMVITTSSFKEKRHSYALEKGPIRWNLQDRNILVESEITGAGKFTTSTNDSPTRMLAQDMNQDEENIELRLELSLNGRFGVNPTKARTSANTSALKMKENEENGELNLGLSLNGRFGIDPRTSRTSSLPTGKTEEEWRKGRRLDKEPNLEGENHPPHFPTQGSTVSGMSKPSSAKEEETMDFATILMYIQEDLVNVADAFFASEAAKKK